jgi:hypothetical protein
MSMPLASNLISHQISFYTSSFSGNNNTIPAFPHAFPIQLHDQQALKICRFPATINLLLKRMLPMGEGYPQLDL